MPDTRQMSTGQSANRATIAAMADVLAATGSGGGIMGWADEQPVDGPFAGRPVAATGVTIGHGAIRLRDSAPPTHEAVAQARGVYGHGTIGLCDRAKPPPSP